MAEQFRKAEKDRTTEIRKEIDGAVERMEKRNIEIRDELRKMIREVPRP